MVTSSDNNEQQQNNSIVKSASTLMQMSSTADFETLFNEDDKELDKKIAFQRNKQGKKVQLLAKINNIQMQISDSEIKYRKSLVSPTIDSVDIAINIRALQEELKIAEAVFTQLFPKEAMEMSAGKSESTESTQK